MPRTIDGSIHINRLKDSYGVNIDAEIVKEYCQNHEEIGYQTLTKYLNQYKIKRGHWRLTMDEMVKESKLSPDQLRSGERPHIQFVQKEEQNLVPSKDDTFVPFGGFTDVKKVLRSNQFYPVFITGLSGNGKTFGVEQACSQLGRELIRVNITVETDEDDLIGGFRLVNGETVWHNGPVIEALERGSILLLDEIDLASNKILCLQSILEGKGVFLKKIGQFVRPKDGFNIVATANTKGKGSDDGRFIGTNVLNEAFLERFPITFEQNYPSPVTENKILRKICDQLNIPMTGDHEKFIVHLVDWAEIVRKTFNEGGIDEVISTRRLVHIIRAYSIFGDKLKAVKICLNRFDDETKESFLQLYTKLDDSVEIDAQITPEDAK